jgi:hypothetical protein
MPEVSQFSGLTALYLDSCGLKQIVDLSPYYRMLRRVWPRFDNYLNVIQVILPVNCCVIPDIFGSVCFSHVKM